MIGQTLGAYRIVEQVGAGGMATVYKAYHAAMDRYVAVKVLPAHFAQDPTFVQRFEREARLIANLEHRHILPVYDFGEQEGITYLVMRYLDAGTLQDKLAGGRLALDVAADYLSQLASALDYAHEQNIVHRDMKPSNVLVDNTGGVFISDFGISKMVGGTSDLTGSGIIGTPAYMAPEQGMGMTADFLSDQYSLGVVLYEMVVGRVPFTAETPMAVMLMHLNQPLPLPGEARPGLPDDVERVILKALAKDPSDRFDNCMALADAFRQSVAGLPVDVARLPDGVEQAKADTKPMGPPGAYAGQTVPVKHEETEAATLPAQVSPPSAPASVSRAWLWPVIALVGIGAVSGAIFFGLGGVGRADSGGSQAGGGDEEDAQGDSTEGSGGDGDKVGGDALSVASLEGVSDGLLVEYCQDVAPGRGLCFMSQDGQEVGRILEDTELAFAYNAPPGWSPDGKQVVFTALAPGESDGQNSIYVVNTDGANLTELITYRNEMVPVWSPDGEWLAFHSNGELATMRPDGSGFAVLQPSRDGDCFEGVQWSPDSQWIVAYVRNDGCDEWRYPENIEIRVVARDGSEAITVAQFLQESSACGLPWMVAFSPDGTQVAYWDAQCRIVASNVDGSGEPEQLREWPYWWTGQFYPQWGEEGG